MTVFKCKICGGSLDVNIGERTAVCEYCGVKQTIPSFIDIKAQEIYNRANSYLSHNEFDKAENLYTQILIDNKSDADAYWNILMCHYGVTYVKDPKTGKYIPTCNRTLYAPIFNDENYINALKFADDKQRELFEANAKAIDTIQKGILAVSGKEKPFDIFISYKETDSNAIRTKDSIAAQDLYEKLTAEGYKVFFSRITLEDKIGTEYEPYIYAALASSKVMITVCSSRENIESVWVKNEWSRFLSFTGQDSAKTLIPLYFDMNKSDLPDDFAHFTSYDMKTAGFEQELIRGIKKLIPLPVMLLEKRKKFRKKLKIAGIAVLTLAIIGGAASIPWFMKLPDYNAAMQLYYDKNYPEATWAFDALGEYRNSTEMKERCELSWRKSLATVAIYDNSTYIDSSGSVKTTVNGRGEDSELKLNEHGRYISLADGTYALHEDGYVENSKINNNLDADWKDIIQISPKFNCTSVALKSDGTMIHGDLRNNPNMLDDTTDDWLSPISTWENIVSFESGVMEMEEDWVWQAWLIGIKSDGTLCGVSYDIDGKDYSLNKILPKFSDVQTVHVILDEDAIQPNIVALTNHGTMMIYNNGNFKEIPADGVIDIAIYIDADYTDHISHLTIDKLMNNGEFRDDSNHVLVNDVVALSDLPITRSGSVYSLGNDHIFNKEDMKVIVFDEWIERLK